MKSLLKIIQTLKNTQVSLQVNNKYLTFICKELLHILCSKGGKLNQKSVKLKCSNCATGSRDVYTLVRNLIRFFFPSSFFLCGGGGGDVESE